MHRYCRPRTSTSSSSCRSSSGDQVGWFLTCQQSVFAQRSGRISTCRLKSVEVDDTYRARIPWIRRGVLRWLAGWLACWSRLFTQRSRHCGAVRPGTWATILYLQCANHNHGITLVERRHTGCLTNAFEHGQLLNGIPWYRQRADGYGDNWVSVAHHGTETSPPSLSTA